MSAIFPNIPATFATDATNGRDGTDPGASVANVAFVAGGIPENENSPGMTTCLTCAGDGCIPEREETFSGSVMEMCPGCRGTGQVPEGTELDL